MCIPDSSAVSGGSSELQRLRENAPRTEHMPTLGLLLSLNPPNNPLRQVVIPFLQEGKWSLREVK